MNPDDMAAFIAARQPRTVLAAIGATITSLSVDAVTVEVEVTDRLRQHAGLVHGGVYVLLGESAASTCAALSVDLATHRVAGMEVNANHLRAVTEGHLRCVARPLHRGRGTQVYSWEVSDDDGPVSVGRCTIAVRRSPPDPS